MISTVASLAKVSTKNLSCFSFSFGNSTHICRPNAPFKANLTRGTSRVRSTCTVTTSSCKSGRPRYDTHLNLPSLNWYTAPSLERIVKAAADNHACCWLSSMPVLMTPTSKTSLLQYQSSQGRQIRKDASCT